MSKDKKTDNNQVWQSIILTLPIVILAQASSSLADNFWHILLYACLLGAVGGLMGHIANKLTRDKGVGTKLLTIAVLLFICSLFIYFVSVPGA